MKTQSKDEKSFQNAKDFLPYLQKKVMHQQTHSSLLGPSISPSTNWFFLSSTNGSATLNPINQNHKFQHRDVFPTPSPRVHLDGNLHKNFKIKRACHNLPQLNDW